MDTTESNVKTPKVSVTKNKKRKNVEEDVAMENSVIPEDLLNAVFKIGKQEIDKFNASNPDKTPIEFELSMALKVAGISYETIVKKWLQHFKEISNGKRSSGKTDFQILTVHNSESKTTVPLLKKKRRTSSEDIKPLVSNVSPTNKDRLHQQTITSVFKTNKTSATSKTNPQIMPEIIDDGTSSWDDDDIVNEPRPQVKKTPTPKPFRQSPKAPTGSSLSQVNKNQSKTPEPQIVNLEDDLWNDDFFLEDPPRIPPKSTNKSKNNSNQKSNQKNHNTQRSNITPKNNSVQRKNKKPDNNRDSMDTFGQLINRYDDLNGNNEDDSF